MQQIHDRAPKAMEALDKALETGSESAIRIVLDRIAPIDLIKDEEVKGLVAALEKANTDLTEELTRLRKQVSTLKSQNTRLRKKQDS
nr:hypothetical protein [uncultured Ruegeria sp.]